MRYLEIILIFFTLKTFAQNEKVFVPGSILKISIVTIDKKTRDSMPLVLIEGFINNKRILSGTSNLKGELNLRICSNKISNNSVIFKTTAVGYKADTCTIILKSDTTLFLKMTLDPLNSMTKKEIESYQMINFLTCGTDQVNQLYIDNPNYRHCDGRILTYRQIIENHEDFNVCELITNK